MTNDCIYRPAVGPLPDGGVVSGIADVERAFAATFAQYPECAWTEARHFVVGDRGVSEWLFVGADRSGSQVRVNGCDLFTFRDNLIAVKDSYRKQN